MTCIQLHSSVRVAMISDSLDLIGIRNNAMSPNIRPLSGDMKIMGFAAPIGFTSSPDYDQADPYALAIEYLDSLRAGEVAVVGTGESTESAFWGELFSTAAKQNGAMGVISDGPLRDVNQILEIGFSAFGVGSRPYDYKGRMKVTSVRQEIICGGVVVAPGDFIIADQDGVIVVPQLVIDEVFTSANKRALSENHVLIDLKAGSTVREAWNKHHIL
jgi:4-hydroxy-4-methyl-2-oxoglutarate aldolase